MRRFWAIGVGLLLAAVRTIEPAAAQVPSTNEITFDVFVFSQEDDVGHPLKAEGMSYQGGRATSTLRLDGTYTLGLSAGVSHIQNEPAAELPATVANARITSASREIIALDASASLTIRKPGAAWTFVPGVTYHHQDAYVAIGPDLTVMRELGGGDTILRAAWRLRFGFPKLVFWDGAREGRDRLVSHTVLLGLTQTLSPSWLLNVALQYTRQDGFQSDPYNYVVLYSDGDPVELTRESLPEDRNRVQLSARLRYSPVAGFAMGIDNSYYLDDWGIRHLAFEPNAAFPLSGDIDGRVWYRVSFQDDTKYFHRMPSIVHSYQTQDSDLDSFTMQTGGLTVAVPVGAAPAAGEGPRWESRGTIFGFYRDDRVYALGANVGIGARW